MKTAVGVFLLLIVAVGSRTAEAGPVSAEASTWEFEVALGAGRLLTDTSYEHRFVPVFDGQTDAEGSARQHLVFETGDEGVWRLGMRRMFGRRLGVQALYGTGDFSLGGGSSPLEVDIQYSSTQPPDYVPTPNTFSGSMMWSDPEGDIELEYLCFNVLSRSRMEKRVQLGLSGGLSLFSVEADFASLGYQAFWLGGHGVLFTETYELGVESERGTTVGANFGLEIDTPIGRRSRFVGEVRAFFSPTVDGLVEPSEVVNGESVIRELPLGEVGPLTSLEIDPSFVSLSIGVRLKL